MAELANDGVLFSASYVPRSRPVDDEDDPRTVSLRRTEAYCQGVDLLTITSITGCSPVPIGYVNTRTGADTQSAQLTCGSYRRQLHRAPRKTM